MSRRIWLIGLSAILALLPFFYRSTAAQPGSIKTIMPGVWFSEGDLMNLGHCNNIFIEMKDYLIVVDANFPSGARLALADARIGEEGVEQTREIRLRHSSPRRSRLREPRLDPVRGDNARVQRGHRGDEALRACSLAVDCQGSKGRG